MGIRFRKSINIGGLKLNISKSGIGYSFGKAGVRFTKTANGRSRQTYSIPKSGISYVKETKKNENNIFSKLISSLIFIFVVAYLILSIVNKDLLENIMQYVTRNF